MGEFVQQSLEELLSVFEQIERVQLFSAEETSEIVKRCRAFEYRLQRQIKSSSDFVRYIDYLSHFLSLIRRRRQATNYWYKKVEIDGAVSRKVEALYRRACERFQGQTDLWLARIKFAKKERHFEAVSRHYMRVLQVQSHKPELWIAAAKHEFEVNGSAENARSLLQRAIRFHSDSDQVWIELFRLELQYVDKLLQRKAKLDSQSEKPQENADLPEAAEDAIMKLKLAEVVFDQILELKRDTSSLALAVWRVAKNFAIGKELSIRMIDQIIEKFPQSEAIWEARVERKVAEVQSRNKDLSAGLNAAIDLPKKIRIAMKNEEQTEATKVFEEALKALPTEKMWRTYLDYQRRFSSDVEDQRNEKLSTIYSRMKEAKMLKAEDFLEWSKICTDSAIDILSNGIKSFPKDARLWKEKLTIQIRNEDSWEDDAYKVPIMKTLNAAIQEVREEDSLELWKLALKWTIQVSPQHTEKVIKSADTVLTPNINGWIRSFYLQWTLETRNMSVVRKRAKKFCKMPPNPLEFYIDVIELEMATSSPDIEHTRDVFEHAIREHGRNSSELWLKFLTFLKSADPALIPSTYQRALSNLDEESAEGFVKSWSLARAN